MGVTNLIDIRPPSVHTCQSVIDCNCQVIGDKRLLMRQVRANFVSLREDIVTLCGHKWGSDDDDDAMVLLPCRGAATRRCTQSSAEFYS